MKSNDRFILYENNDQFNYEKNNRNILIKFNRVAFIFFIFFIVSLIYSIHLIHLGSRNPDNSKIRQPKIYNELKRADIVDRNGNFLAKTVSSIDIGINPAEIIDQKKLLLSLGIIFPNKNYQLIQRKFEKNKFFWFEKKITDDDYERVMMLGDKSIKPEEKLSRVYPQKNLFSHIIGQIDDNNNGISGLEKTLDDQLKKNENTIQLTVDKNIQFLIRNELIRYNEIFKSQGSAALLMNVNNGEILSLVSLPDFNPNERINITDVNFINRVTKGTYELGSVFKVFTYANALNEGLIEPETEFLNLPKSISCYGFPITEYDNKISSDLTAEQILIQSGNIGSVRIAQKIGPEKHEAFLKNVGILEDINFDIEEVAPQKNYQFGKCKLATASFGHGIATTILQLAKGYAILSNGGFEIRPTLIKNESEIKKTKKRIIKKEVSKKIVTALRKIVNTEEGTAKFADVPGYEIGGKTGTADKVSDGVYSEGKVNTFASVFPTSNPKFIFVVMLDEPQKSSDYYYKYRHRKGGWKGTLKNTAGWTSVEVAGQIIEKIGPILATKYNEVE